MNSTDPVFNTKKERLLELWTKLQCLQTDFAYRQELSLFYKTREWISANQVLDAGCGNGYYLNILSRFFKEKSWTGIDLSPELIEIAKSNYQSTNFNFIVDDFHEIGGVYDAIIMRLFLQHLTGPDKTIEHAKKILKPGGILIIIDSVDEHRYYHPEIRNFYTLFLNYRKSQAEQGRNRDIVSEMASHFSNDPEWEIRCNQDIIIPSTLSGNAELFLEVYTSFVDMVETVGELDHPFGETRKELRDWSHAGGYTQIGLKLLGVVSTINQS